MSPSAFGFEMPFDRIANVRGHVFEIRQAIRSSWNTLAVVPDCQILPAMLAAACYSDLSGVRVDAVFNKLCYGFERIALRKGDDTYGVPIVADPQFAFLRCVRAGCAVFRH